jgi:hypothetical protein
MDSQTHLILIEVIMAAGFSVITLFIGYCIAEVKRVKKEVVIIVEREKFESVMAQRRIDVLDSISSDMAEHKFNSRHVVEHGHNPPRIHGRLRKLLSEEG